MWRHASQLAAAGVDALKGYAGLDAEMVDSLVQAGAEFGLPVIVDLGSRGDGCATWRFSTTRSSPPPLPPGFWTRCVSTPRGPCRTRRSGLWPPSRNAS